MFFFCPWTAHQIAGLLSQLFSFTEWLADCAKFSQLEQVVITTTTTTTTIISITIIIIIIIIITSLIPCLLVWVFLSGLVAPSSPSVPASSASSASQAPSAAVLVLYGNQTTIPWKFNSSPLKIYHPNFGKDRLPVPSFFIGQGCQTSGGHMF